MKLSLLSGIAAGLFCFGAISFAQPDVTITVVTTFDVPGAGNSTTPFKIDDAGNISGYFIDTEAIVRGFLRLSNGRIRTIVEPNDTGNFTRSLGINNSLTICGDFFNVADNTFHGYFLSGRTFTQFDAAPNVSTYLGDLNNAGNFVGSYGSLTQPNQAFIDIGGVLTPITIAASTGSYGQGLNNLNDMVGLYFDSASVNHGFFRDAAGTVTAPLDFPGSSDTHINGINDKKWAVGNYNDSAEVEHSFFLRMPNSFTSFDYPGAIGTSLNGINKTGLMCGSYVDGSGVHHGFIAQVSR
jgi:hypothetical protein